MKTIYLFSVLLITTQLSACAVVAVADAAVSVVANTVSVAADVVGGVVDVLIPDGDDAAKPSE